MICTGSGYIDLLGMRSNTVVQVLTDIAGILRSTDEASIYIGHMLRDRNWRSHLIASAAALLSREPSQYASAQWATFDRGSWVAPQLAVSLYWSDPDFPEEARRRIVARCPIDDSDYFFRGMTRNASAKNLASLLGVMKCIRSDAYWAASELQAAEVQDLLESDIDAAGTIVHWWFDEAQKRFSEFGRTLIAASEERAHE
jgi:hypothetical protein